MASVCEGTILELLSARQANISVENYIDRISRKTACLMSACCKGGAIVGGGSEAQIALLGQFGLDLGIAFQIIDDVLDYVAPRSPLASPRATICARDW